MSAENQIDDFNESLEPNELHSSKVFQMDLDNLVKNERTALPAGIYFIGDPKPIFEKKLWRETRKQFRHGLMLHQAQGIKLSSGQPLFAMETTWGSGVFRDNKGSKYPVSSGVIVVMPLMSDLADQYNQQLLNRHGVVRNFDEPFLVLNQDGHMKIGPILIDTEENGHDEDDLIDHSTNYLYWD